MTDINVELQVTSHGLDPTYTHDYKDIICESDSFSTLKFFKDGVPDKCQKVVIQMNN